MCTYKLFREGKINDPYWLCIFLTLQNILCFFSALIIFVLSTEVFLLALRVPIHELRDILEELHQHPYFQPLVETVRNIYGNYYG